MCELFGICAAAPVRANPWLQEFYNHSVHHPNGWGLAVLDGSTRIRRLYREAVPAWKSALLARLLEKPLDTSGLIGHIRLATCGSVIEDNCHPFTGTDASGRQWILAHNGTVFRCPALEHLRRAQTGSTDSERILMRILEAIGQETISNRSDLSDEERFAQVEKVLTSLAPDNKLNLLFSDGSLYYVFTNCIGCLFRRRTDTGWLFATVPLDEEAWEPVSSLRLQAYRNGELVLEGKLMKACCQFDPNTQPMFLPLQAPDLVSSRS